MLVRDISSVYGNVRRMAGIFTAALCLVLFFAVDMIFWLVKRRLRPLGELERTAMGISQGDYELRMRVRTEDEVGRVGRVFNSMAEQIENQMRELEDVPERREQLLGGLTHELRTPMTSIIRIFGYPDECAAESGTAEKSPSAYQYRVRPLGTCTCLEN